jgi:hypothetical protein
MRIVVVFVCLLFCFGKTFSQDLEGEWKGSFTDDSHKFYILEDYKINFHFTELSDSVFRAYSKTIWTVNKIKDSSICILEGGFLKKNILYLKETRLIKGFSSANSATCFQIMELYYHKRKNKLILSGKWYTEGSECGYGSISLTKKL